MTVTRYIGDDWEIPGVVNTNGVPVDLTGATVTSQLRRRAGSSSLILEFDVTVTDAVAGAVTLSADSTDTADIPAGTYKYDLEVVGADASVTTYGAGSKVKVLAVVTA